MEKIQSPLMDLGDGIRASRTTLSLWKSRGDLGNTTRLGAMHGVFRESRRFYSRDGKVFRISSVSPEPRFSAWQRFLAHTFHNPWLRFRAELTSMKKRIRELLDHDPGDILYQFTGAEEWEQGLNSSSTIPELFDFIVNRAMAHY